MNSIGKKIQTALVSSVLVVGVFAAIVLIVNQLNTFQNQRLIRTMTLEYSIISTSDKLISSYNDVVKNPDNQTMSDTYKRSHASIENTLELLKKQIISEESKILLLGVENTVHQVISECDTGLSEVRNNRFQEFSAHFAQAHKYNEFVRTNTSLLLQKELEYLSKTQDSSQKVYAISISIAISIFILITIVLIVFARAFTKELTTPLTRLSLYAKDVASGNLQGATDKNLTGQNDEIGSLAQSIYTMVDKLVLMLTQEKQASEIMKKTSDSLAVSNQELQRMNTLMTGREMKMIELKKEIESLKMQIPTR